MVHVYGGVHRQSLIRLLKLLPSNMFYCGDDETNVQVSDVHLKFKVRSGFDSEWRFCNRLTNTIGYCTSCITIRKLEFEAAKTRIRISAKATDHLQ